VKRFVLDASVSLRWFLDNPVPAYATRVKQQLSEGARAVVPVLWHLEMANGFAVAERRGMLAAADADLCVAQTEQLATHWIESEMELFSIRQALSMARTFQLSSYDAAYLDAARRNGLPLATLDQSLRTAAARAGVELVR
jgi:predicted nucleic acid-binding protein